ncbi:MAG: hypothetical protein N3G77_01295 [Nitrososphaeria archaeon]|nr:hypothetical protein [Nitrososphaeria archaeon]
MTSKKKVKLELTNDDGDRLILIMEGRIDREKLIQLADFLELYSGHQNESSSINFIESSKLSKLARVITKYFPLTFFSSRDVVEAYIAEYREPLSLSTASTYLARLADRGFLERHGTGNNIRYKLANISGNTQYYLRTIPGGSYNITSP